MIFVAGSGMLGVSIALNAVSLHGTCTAVFVIIAALVACALASIRTLGRISWLAWVGMFCIATSSELSSCFAFHISRPILSILSYTIETRANIEPVFLVTIAVGVQDRPAAAPQDDHWTSDYRLFGNPTFAQGVAAYGALLFACSATPTYYALVAEMRDPTKFTRSLVTAQIGSTCIYLTIAVVVYYYCGTYVASPALGSAGPLIKRIAYGIALPGLAVTTTLFIHVGLAFKPNMYRASIH